MLLAFEENGGEYTEEMQEVLAINRIDLDAVIEDQLTILYHLNSDIEEFKEQIEKYKKKIECNKKIIQVIRDGIRDAVKKYGTENKLKSNGYSFSVGHSKSLNVVNKSAIPTEYLSYTLKTPLNREIKLSIARLLSRFPIEFEETVKVKELKEAFGNGLISNTRGFEIIEKEHVTIK